jgi:hypothetical protein
MVFSCKSLRTDVLELMHGIQLGIYSNKKLNLMNEKTPKRINRIYIEIA